MCVHTECALDTCCLDRSGRAQSANETEMTFSGWHLWNHRESQKEEQLTLTGKNSDKKMESTAM